MDKRYGQYESVSASYSLGDNDEPSFALHHGDFMNNNRANPQVVKDLDGISAMDVPSSWSRFDRNGSLSRSVVLSQADDSSTEIGFLERNRPVDQKSLVLFEDLVSYRHQTPRLLYSENLGTDSGKQTFKTLANALGSSLVGDNQLSSPDSGAASRIPAFHLESARVETLNGKNVIAVDGWFNQMDERAQPKMESDQPAKRYYSGIFFAAGGGASKVDEIYLTATDQKLFQKNASVYQSIMKSIKWR